MFQAGLDDCRALFWHIVEINYFRKVRLWKSRLEVALSISEWGLIHI